MISSASKPLLHDEKPKNFYFFKFMAVMLLVGFAGVAGYYAGFEKGALMEATVGLDEMPVGVLASAGDKYEVAGTLSDKDNTAVTFTCDQTFVTKHFVDDDCTGLTKFFASGKKGWDQRCGLGARAWPSTAPIEFRSSFFSCKAGKDLQTLQENLKKAYSKVTKLEDGEEIEVENVGAKATNWKGIDVWGSKKDVFDGSSGTAKWKTIAEQGGGKDGKINVGPKTATPQFTFKRQGNIIYLVHITW